MISLNQNPIDKIKQVKAKKTKKFALRKLCIVKTPVVVKLSKDMDVFNGHGEGDTRWKG